MLVGDGIEYTPDLSSSTGFYIGLTRAATALLIEAEVVAANQCCTPLIIGNYAVVAETRRKLIGAVSEYFLTHISARAYGFARCVAFGVLERIGKLIQLGLRHSDSTALLAPACDRALHLAQNLPRALW